MGQDLGAGCAARFTCCFRLPGLVPMDASLSVCAIAREEWQCCDSHPTAFLAPSTCPAGLKAVCQHTIFAGTHQRVAICCGRYAAFVDFLDCCCLLADGCPDLFAADQGRCTGSVGSCCSSSGTSLASYRGILDSTLFGAVCSRVVEVHEVTVRNEVCSDVPCTGPICCELCCYVHISAMCKPITCLLHLWLIYCRVHGLLHMPSLQSTTQHAALHWSDEMVFNVFLTACEVWSSIRSVFLANQCCCCLGHCHIGIILLLHWRKPWHRSTKRATKCQNPAASLFARQ